MGGLTGSIFNHPVCGADPRPEKVDIREDYEEKTKGTEETLLLWDWKIIGYYENFVFEFGETENILLALQTFGNLLQERN